MRPEEERSITESAPEITPPPAADQQGPMQWATAVVARWENELAVRFGSASGLSPVVAGLILTQDVRDRMRDDIVVLINQVIAREHNTP